MNTPLVEEEQAFEAARARYQEIGVPFPECVVRVSSPLAGTFAAPIAACLATGHRNRRVLDSVLRAVDDTAGERIGRAVRDAVEAATAGSTRGSVHGAAATALHADLPAARGRAKRDDLWDTVNEAVDADLRAAVEAAVGGARQDTIRGEIRRLWRARLPAPGVWWWWPFRDFVLFCPPPSDVHREPAGEDEQARPRLHRADGPAVAWKDGFGLCFWRGTHVPPAVVDDTLTADEIIREPNAEIRRCAIERRGWDRFVIEARLDQIGPAVPDPGNPGQTLTLHDVPPGVYPTNVRVLLCTNGTVERDGTRRRFGLTVPAACTDPIEAAAWTYGLTPAQYAQAQRRS
ncbi:hypothetical protein HCN51_39700 [Nonomuraea sp. FMUSA5-5]|uniref:DUF6745 domain-containing protein n=1 Tax=Nonomuraea composti TaxID=2720023 RepID=A0ABX1BK54_9ACTN|nr:hypothetical protein [Nonomuraea sp. FMUSA5-5]NJP95493.1 hypothetical protein [Nonomuraea sp. FMUSA5-5]